MLYLQNLSVKKSNSVLIKNLSISIQPSEILEVYGKNGSGKTSLLRIIAGVSEQCSGFHNSIFFEKFFIPSHGGFRLELTPLDIVEDLLKGNRKLAEKQLCKVGLSDYLSRPASHLSEGQKKRMLIASIPTNSSGLLIIDEPFNGLDFEAKKIFLELLKEFNLNNGMIILATHIPIESVISANFEKRKKIEFKINKITLGSEFKNFWKNENSDSQHTNTIFDSETLSKKKQLIKVDLHTEIKKNLKRETKLIFSQFSDITWPIVFLWMFISVLPFGIGHDIDILSKIASGIFWFGTFIVMVFASNRLFEKDLISGSIDQILSRQHSLTIYCTIKAIVNWLFLGISLSLIAFPLAALYGLNLPSLISLSLSLFIGTFGISIILTLFSALALMAKQAQILVGLLSFPSIVPFLIFGTAAVNSVLSGSDAINLYLILISISLLAFLTLPLICSTLIKLALD